MLYNLIVLNDLYYLRGTDETLYGPYVTESEAHREAQWIYGD